MFMARVHGFGLSIRSDVGAGSVYGPSLLTILCDEMAEPSGM